MVAQLNDLGLKTPHGGAWKETFQQIISPALSTYLLLGQRDNWNSKE
jgi:hypothetical protein